MDECEERQAWQLLRYGNETALSQCLLKWWWMWLGGGGRRLPQDSPLAMTPGVMPHGGGSGVRMALLFPPHGAR